MFSFVVMPLKRFRILSRVLRFDDRATRPARRESDKLAPIQDLWNLWVERLQMMFNPGPDIQWTSALWHSIVDAC